MENRSSEALPGEVIEMVTLTQLCQSCGVQTDWVVELVNEGVLEPQGHDPKRWQFSAVSITRVRVAWHLQRDLGVNRAGIALALNLLEEREALRQQLQRFGRSVPGGIVDADGS